MRPLTRVGLGLVLCLACSESVLASGSTFLSMTSDPGDYIGGGATYLYTSADGSFSISGTSTVGVSASFQTPDYSHWWYLHFVPPVDRTLVPGVFDFATRWPFQSPTVPGMDVSGDGRGCNTEQSRFVVWDAQYGSNGTVTSFAVDFEQHCEGDSAALFGSLRYQSTEGADARISVGPTESYEGNGEMKMLRFPVSLSARVDAPVSVDYETIQETAHAGVDYVSVSGTLTFAAGQTFAEVLVPILGNTTVQPDRRLILELSSPVGAPLGFSDAEGLIVDDDSPATLLFFNGDPLDWVGAGQVFTDRMPLDGIFVVNGSPSGVHASFTGDTWWDLDFVPPAGTQLDVGAYEGATRYPFQAASEPGLSVDGDGRGCNTLTGRFVVEEATYVDGNVQSFAVDFIQHCEGGYYALYGAFRYNSSFPLPGDVNGDSRTNVSDVFALINFLFADGPAPLRSADVNGDGKLDVEDVFYLIDYLFAGGRAPKQ